MRLPTLLALAALNISCGSAGDPGQQPLRGVFSGASSRTSALLSLHKSLVEIPSISDSENEVSHFLKGYLEKQGLNVETQVVQGGKNIFAYAGTSRKTRILVTSHIDTVPPFWPYERKGDEIWGRGSVDAKGSVAAQVIAFQELLDAEKLRDGDVSLLFVVGEENSGRGMKAANNLGLSWEAVIFGEPTELKLASGHKGGIGFKLVAKGKAGHSGYPEQGENAIDLLVKGLASLQKLELPWSERFGNSTLNVGRIEGGVAANVIPADASATALIRIAAGSPEKVLDLVRDAVYNAAPELEVESRAPGKGPVPIDYDIQGFETAVMNYGTDIPNLEGNHKRYLYGPGTILVAHSDHEHLTTQDLETAVDGYKVLITENLKKGR
ncbi:hypothetical protein BKA67DRAFT_537864 [Truncatella angustata]|uniref:Peptidase M20 dimerisation domain-containing protein n=1 Tax=Truncatella angustata TaxID=152316 RepID=A0A9P8UH51_9PEZI|nr:uncharacterized protein BKA67DRAFT_537864 [Truncatella angustata]KAH6652018.1 hypothetical protein BKA67DRAFT_537864 [Truncatella angustata]KAH8195212.1 hypothetical protein TruAng_010630 [Truncatella angustata]